MSPIPQGAPQFDDAFRARLRELLAWRRDVRRFRRDPLPEGAVERLIEIACLAPSVGLSQPWRFVLVDAPERRAAIARNFAQCNDAALAAQAPGRAAEYARLKLAGLADAPAHLAVLADPETEQGHRLGRLTMPEMIQYSAVAAVHTLWLAARAEGIGMGWVSILDPETVREILDVPASWRLIGYFCLGYPAAADDRPELEREGWEARRPAGDFYGAAMSKEGEIRVGIGGWVFPPWRGTFYPKEVKQADELAYASRHVTAIEINGTFYRLQTPASYQRWHDATQEDFVFSLKGSRFITHRSDLSTAAPFMERFFDSGMTELGPKLGPILWQFMPSLQFDEGNVAAFLEALPKRLGNRTLCHVLEVRNESFTHPAFARLMEKHAAAIAWVEDDKVPLIEAVTADFVYARLRRCSEAEPTGYSPAALDKIAARFQEHAKAGRDCFVYFINGAKIRAPHAAMALIERLKR